MLSVELLPPPYAKDPFLSGIVRTTNRILADAQRSQQRWHLTVFGLRDNIRSLTNEVATLKKEIQHLHHLRTFVVPLTTLAPQPFQMRLPIPVTIEGDGEDFTASFMEANVSASGETEADAIANLKDSLLSSYEVLENLPDSELGPLPMRQWEVLKSVVERID
jgi:predicted RNase H-like HicB family nuclease